MVFNVIVLDNDEIGEEALIIGPYSSGQDAYKDYKRAYEWVKSKGYEEEYTDYRIWTGVHISNPRMLDDRSKPGRFHHEHRQQ